MKNRKRKNKGMKEKKLDKPQDAQKKEEPKEKTEETPQTEKGLVRVKLLRALYFPINERACKVSVPKDEIVRVSSDVYSDYKGDLKKLGPGKTTAEESEKKVKFMDKVLSSKNFAVNK